MTANVCRINNDGIHKGKKEIKVLCHIIGLLKYFSFFVQIFLVSSGFIKNEQIAVHVVCSCVPTPENRRTCAIDHHFLILWSGSGPVASVLPQRNSLHWNSVVPCISHGLSVGLSLGFLFLKAEKMVTS